MVDIEFKQNGLHGEAWWCAYTTLQNISKSEYTHETYRDGNKIGVDTMGYDWLTLDEKKIEAETQIMEIVAEHARRNGGGDY